MTRVLVVEDEDSFSDAISYLLRKEGFEVAVCSTGPDALETFDRIGADDYVTKPFSSRELVARMRAVLRRRGDADDAAETALESGPVRMDVDRHVVTVRGGTVQLPLKEFELLQVAPDDVADDRVVVHHQHSMSHASTLPLKSPS